MRKEQQRKQEKVGGGAVVSGTKRVRLGQKKSWAFTGIGHGVDKRRRNL